MPNVENLSLRVNGFVYEHVGLQCEIVDGYPSGPKEVVVKDDPVGPFALTDDCVIELKENGGDWRPVSVPYLITLLQTYLE